MLWMVGTEASLMLGWAAMNLLIALELTANGEALLLGHSGIALGFMVCLGCHNKIP